MTVNISEKSFAKLCAGLKFDALGLIPAIVQDAETGAVLTLAYMNAESLKISLNEGRTCFYSRSRDKIWRKGEESGHIQYIRSVSADCDGDALLVRVNPQGPACHTGAASCFFNQICGGDERDAEGGVPCTNEGLDAASVGDAPLGVPKPENTDFTLVALYALLQSRKREMPPGSYTTYLFEKGRDKILKKIGEECAEVIIAAKDADFNGTVYEIADLCYHVLALMVNEGVTTEDIRAELAKRQIVDKKIKQEKPE